MPAELFMTISTMTGRVSPSVIRTSSMAAAESEWIETDGPTLDAAAEVALRLDLETFVATLPPGDGEVAKLWLLHMLEPDEIAARLGKKPNAVYQARSRIAKRLREWLAA